MSRLFVAPVRSFFERWWRYAIVLALLVLAFVLGQRASRRLVVLLAAAVVLPVVLREPRLGLMGLPAVSLFVPFEIGTGTQVSLNMTVFAIPGLAVVWLVQKASARDKIRLTSSRLNRPLVAFLLVTLFSLLGGNVMWDPAVPRPSNMLLVQLGQVSIYVLSFVVFWLAANLANDLCWLRRIAYAFVLTAGAAISILLLLRRLPISRALLPRGALPHLVGVWTAGLSLALVLYDRKLRPWQRAFLLLALVETMIGLQILRRAWVASWVPPLVTVAAVLWLHSPRSRWILAIGAVLVVVIVGVPALMRAVDWEVEWETSGASRLLLWRSVIELAGRSPLLGLGPAAYRHYHYLKPLTYRHITWLVPNVSAHNMFVGLFAQVGLLGLACYVWFLVEVVLMAGRLYARSTGFAQGYALAVWGALAGTVAADMFAATSLPFVYNVGFWGFRGTVLGWMLLGGLLVLENLNSQAQTARVPENS